jgi:hypothetical protein
MKEIAIILDFDDTLCQDSTTGFLTSKGVDTNIFWNDTVESLLEKDWDPIPAYLYAITTVAKKHNITKDDFINYGKTIIFNKGVESFFQNIKKEIQNYNDDSNIEFFIISSGIGDIIRNSCIAVNFRNIWSSNFSYDKDGFPIFPSNVVSFTDKTRYLFNIEKGIIGNKALANPFAVNKYVENKNIHIPFENMLFIGDGYTDIPCFSIVKSRGGKSIAVYNREHKEKFKSAWKFVEENRVTNLHSSDFSKGSDLYNTILMAAYSILDKY